MWFFMILCYAFTFVSVAMLLLNGFQGYWPFPILTANHATFAVLTIIIYLFTETLVIFFFVGVGVSIKEYTQTHRLSTDFQRRSLAIKRRIYPPLLLNMLLVMILFISGGAVDTGHLSGWIHGILFYISFFHFLYAIAIQHGSFREITEVVLEMSGVDSKGKN